MLLKGVLFQSQRIMASRWISSGVKGFLLDVYGVLYDGSSDVPISGSVEAVKK